ncbi:cobalamin-binding protein [Thiomicrorhabdus sp. Kp2]|uniref:cobalamin-binding protein n=1 Tax=Thiomicrorhabdus sp. Kp2 TaxID=1123518 RepID=UPI00040714C9|nr:cobalamin-binding protein [Thiomicrorhabdus sp. Kp2]
MNKLLQIVWLLFLSLQSYQAWSNEIKPVNRIISLAPHITELVYSAGAGDKLVGVADYSDFPKQAKLLPVVGSSNTLNIEAIIALNPELIIGWESAIRPQDLAKLRSLGFNVWQTEVKNLTDITSLIIKIGEKAGTLKTAKQIAQKLNFIIQTEKTKYQNKPMVTAFYQVWQMPLMTINGQQFISLAMNVCGAKNAFADLPMLASEINIESLIKRNPDVFLIGGEQAFQQAWKDKWLDFPMLNAVKNQQLYLLNNDLYQRPTARLLENLPALCEIIDQARKVSITH